MIKKILILFLLCSLSSACFLPHLVDSVERSGVTASGRRGLLNSRLGDFHSNVYWGKKDLALAMVTPQAIEMFKTQLTNRPGSAVEEKIIEAKVDSVDFDPEARTATVKVFVKYYKVPFYTVNTRLEEETWIFDLARGWLINDRKIGGPV